MAGCTRIGGSVIALVFMRKSRLHRQHEAYAEGSREAVLPCAAVLPDRSDGARDEILHEDGEEAACGDACVCGDLAPQRVVGLDERKGALITP